MYYTEIILDDSIDQSLPNLELEKGIVNYVTLDKETKDQFIPEDLDPVKALLTASVRYYFSLGITNPNNIK